MNPLSSTRQLFHQFPRIKVCGVTLDNDLLFLKTCKVEAVGLNLVPSSKRYLALDKATCLAARAAELGLLTVAVVMDPSERELKSVVQAFCWDFIQLHGQEAPELAEACEGIAIIKAASWSGRPEEERLVGDWSAHFGSSVVSSQNSGSVGPCKLAGFLLDAYVPGQAGGSGQKARWDLIYPRPKSLENWPIMLAGGLNAENVCSAIQATVCNGVDTASGVEASSGVKCAELVKRFASAAEAGFASIRGLIELPAPCPKL